MSDLKPCKKCKWEHPREIRYGHLQGRQDTYRITCPNCSYCTKEKSSMSEAIEAWNRRVGEEDDHSICGATNLPCIRCNPGGCDNRKEGAD